MRQTRKKKRMGRPPMPKGTAKSVNLNIRLSQNELKVLLSRAKAAGMSLGAYIMAPHRREG